MSSITVSFGGYVTTPTLRDTYLEKGVGKLVTKLLSSKDISTRLRDNTVDEEKVKEFERTATLTQKAFLTYVSFGTVALIKQRAEIMYDTLKTAGMPEEALKPLKDGMENFQSAEKVRQAANTIKGYLVDNFKEEPFIAESLQSLEDLRKKELSIAK